MGIGLLLLNGLDHPLFLSLGKADFVSGFPTACPRLHHCLLPSSVGIVVQGCELCACYHAFVGKVLTLGAVFQLFGMVHLNLSCVAELCQLLDILQKFFV